MNLLNMDIPIMRNCKQLQEVTNYCGGDLHIKENELSSLDGCPTYPTMLR